MKLKSVLNLPNLSLHSVVAAFLLCSIHPAQAAVLARYDFTGSSDASSDTDSNTTAADLAVGAGFLPYHSFNTSFGNSAPSRQTAGTPNNQTANLLSGDFYYQFTVTPDAGYKMDLTSITFDFGASYSSSSQIGWRLYSSVDGFDPGSGDIIASNVFASSAQAANSFTLQTSDLTPSNPNPSVGTDFQNLTVPVTFRLYINDASTTAGSVTRFDNVTLNGVTSPVPEPSPSVMVAFGVAGLLCLRRRFRMPGFDSAR